MLYYILKYINDVFDPPGLGVIEFITFRASAAAVTALLICLVFGPWFIMYLKGRIIEPVKEEAPPEHRKKRDIPTMGGLLIIIAIEISVFLWARFDDPHVWLIMLAVFWMGAIGFLDDYMKVVLKVKGGLSPRYKLIGQIALGLFIGLYTWYDPAFSVLRSTTTVPFFKNLTIDYGIFYILGSAIAVIALLIKQELLLPVLAGIFFIETLSVSLQVLYFKYTKMRFGQGRRIFLMAPLHHHFQLKGWPEQKIVIRFWIITVLFFLASLMTLKLR